MKLNSVVTLKSRIKLVLESQFLKKNLEMLKKLIHIMTYKRTLFYETASIKSTFFKTLALAMMGVEMFIDEDKKCKY